MVEQLFPVPGLEMGRAYRPSSAHTAVTGHALNVARALNDLGEPVMAVVAAGGRRGREIEERLLAEGLPHRVVGVRRESRAGVTLYGQGSRTTVHGPRPALSDHDVEAILATLRGLAPARAIVLGGGTLRPDLYRRVCAMGVPMVLDCCGASMNDCIRVGNVLIACPDRYECLEVFGCEDPSKGARQLGKRGARWAVVLEDHPAQVTYRTGGASYRVQAPDLPVVQPGGADEALLAGLIFALGRGPRKAIAFAAACGLHNMQRVEVAHVDPSACEALAERLEVVEIGTRRSDRQILV
jgi:fructose-1-phosphate kinase PfkB-like protein